LIQNETLKKFNQLREEALSQSNPSIYPDLKDLEKFESNISNKEAHACPNCKLMIERKGGLPEVTC